MRKTTVAVLLMMFVATIAVVASPVDGTEESHYYAQLDGNAKAVYDALAPYEGYYEPQLTVQVPLPETRLFGSASEATEYAELTSTVALWAKYFSEPLFIHLWGLPAKSPVIEPTTSSATVTVNGSTEIRTTVTSVKLTLTVDDSLRDGIKDKVEAVKAAAKAITVSGSNDAEKAKSIAKAVGSASGFKEEMDGEGVASNIYDCLVGGTSGPRGFAQSFVLVSQLNGLTAIAVNGTFYKDATEGSPSMWNSVRYDGKWYDVDVIKTKEGYDGSVMAGTTTILSSGSSNRLHATVYVPERITGESIDLFPPTIEREGYDYPDLRPIYEKYADYILLAIVAIVVMIFMVYAVRTGNVRLERPIVNVL